MDADTHTHSLTVAQAATALGVSERTVWRYLKSGRLSGTTVGPVGGQRTLIDPDAVTALRTGRIPGEVEELRSRVQHLTRELALAQAERDALTERVAALQLALARPAPDGIIERAATGVASAMARLRAVRTA
jgi:excisionase family DNA binding protein